MKSSRAKWWVTNGVTSTWRVATQLEQRRGGVGVDQPGGDGHVLDPQVLEVQRGRLAVDADVGDVPAGPHQRGGQLEGGRHADGLDGDVGAEPVGQLGDDRRGVLAVVVDDDVGAEALGGVEPAVGLVDGDDVGGAEEPGAHDGGQPDRPGAHDRDDVARAHVPVEDADLVAGGQDVGEHQQLLVGHAVGSEVGGGVGERHPDLLGLRAVDQVAEDPAAAAEALAVAALPAEAAGAAGGDAGHEHAVADLAVLHAGADRLDGADRLVAEDAAVGHGRARRP